MPLSLPTLRELFARLGAERVAAATRPLSIDDQPLPPRLPSDRDAPQPGEAAADGPSRRRALLESQGFSVAALCDPAAMYADALLRGNIENYLGVARVPVGLIGPLRVRGTVAQGDYYVPMATTEGALVASYNRGAKAVSLCGGVSTVCLAERVGRAPGFVFRDLGDAARFLAFALDHEAEMKAVAAGTTRHGALAEIKGAWDGDTVVLLLEFTTGDAAGQNMVTVAADAVCRFLVEKAPVRPEFWAIDSNLSSDKKATHLSLTSVRGKRVTAEVRIPRAVVEAELRTTAAACARFWRLFTAFGVQSGMIGIQGHFANALAAVYLACGQDVACVAESAIGSTRMEEVGDGDLYVAVSLPNVIVGTVGGGTALPTQRECLALVGGGGEGSARRLAEICAATALCGEVSGAAALTAGHFADAHRRLGRKSP